MALNSYFTLYGLKVSLFLLKCLGIFQAVLLHFLFILFDCTIFLHLSKTKVCYPSVNKKFSSPSWCSAGSQSLRKRWVYMDRLSVYHRTIQTKTRQTAIHTLTLAPTGSLDMLGPSMNVFKLEYLVTHPCTERTNSFLLWAMV